MPIFVHHQLSIPDFEVWITTSRSGGPGGQHVNTTDSKVTLHWAPANSSVLNDQQKAQVLRRLDNRINQDGVLQIDVSEHRSQHRNREIAEQRLGQLVAKALQRKKRRIRTRPTRGSIERRLKAKKIQAEKKQQRQAPVLYRDK